MPVTPRSYSPPVVSEDAVDKLIGAIGGMATEVRQLSEKVESSGRDSRYACKAVDEFRVELKRLADRQDRTERLAGKTERDRRVDVLNANESDAKIASAQDGFVIALDETRVNSKKAAELATVAITAIADLKRTGREIVVENKAQTKSLAVVAAEEAKKPKVPAKLAHWLNLAVVLGYLILELLKKLDLAHVVK